jgi:hypothetical protein
MDKITPDSWRSTLRTAIEILGDLDRKGFGVRRETGKE